ncbi:hypothetical protein V491_00427 [Pseudogymnoascus sp. VKM F-3775]|nr:hypothetical protein V491_00427 [Pseudogymnoascus sp. VKM F-3775]
MHQFALLKAENQHLQQANEVLSKCRRARKTRLQQGGTLSQQVAQELQDEKDVVQQIEQEIKASGGRKPREETRAHRCGKCGGTKHNARMCQIEVDTSEEDGSDIVQMALSRESIAAIFSDAHEERVTSLAKAVINQDGFLDDDWVRDQCEHSSFTVLSSTYLIFSEVPQSVIQALIRGDLPEVAILPAAEIHQLQKSSYVSVPPNGNITMPSIYAIYLNKFDNDSTLELAENLKERIRNYNPQIPLPGGLVDIGFSADSATRILQHVGNFNSNLVMQQFRAAANHIFGVAKYGLYGFIIWSLRKFNLCGLAEVMFSRLAQSYTSRGGGFNGLVAGRSLTGGRNLSVISGEEIGAMEHTAIFKDNYAEDMARMKTISDIEQRWRSLAEKRALQDIIIMTLPKADQERIRRNEAALRATLYGDLAGGRDSPSIAAADQDDGTPAGQDTDDGSRDAGSPANQAADSPARHSYSSQIGSSESGLPICRKPSRDVHNNSSHIEDDSQSAHGRPIPAHGDDDEDDSIQDSSN